MEHAEMMVALIEETEAFLAYFDDFPSDVLASAHRTRKGAEKAAAWMEHLGTVAHRISIIPNHSISNWELDYVRWED